MSPEGILKREIATGVPMIYRLNADSTVASKLDLGGLSCEKKKLRREAELFPSPIFAGHRLMIFTTVCVRGSTMTRS